MTRSIAIERNVDVDFETGAQTLCARAETVVLDDVQGGTLALETSGEEGPRKVVATLSNPHELDPHAVEVPIRLAAVEQPDRFPTFHGAIELSALSEHPPQSQLALVGDLESPSSLLGKLTGSGVSDLDGALQSVLDRVADRLRSSIAQDGTGD